MRINRLFSLLLVLLLTGQVFAQQPYGPCWHPVNIKTWTPSSDKDFKFNKATVRIQPRFQNTNLNANPYQHYEGQICSMITMNQACSQTPSQEAFNFIGCNPTFWQYMDIVAWWGGAAGEGIITPPVGPAIDAAHINGVKILGTIFFPPDAFGGRGEWVDEMLTVENGKYIYAEKLYEIAAAYGFDGWLINEETYHGGLLNKWAEFVKEFDKCKVANGDDHMVIAWYDNSMSVTSRKSLLQNDGFRYMQEYASYKYITKNLNEWRSAGFAESDFIKKNFIGVQQRIQEDEFNAIFSKEKHNSSVFIFKPEETTWKGEVEKLLNSPNASGAQAYEAMTKVFKNEEQYWVGASRNPSSTEGWTTVVPGISTAVAERSVIQKKPFITTFGTGLGKARYVNGINKGTQDWYHRGMQDILPTWRWWTEDGCPLSFIFDWDNAYNSGSSLKVSGKTVGKTNYLVRLYKTNLEIENGDKFQLIYKTSTANSIEVKLGTSNNTTTFETFTLQNIRTENGWTVAEADLSSIAGKTVSVIALNFRTNYSMTAYTASLGQLGILNGNYSPQALPVTNLKTESELSDTGGDIRLVWDLPQTITDIHHYNIYLTQRSTRTLVGQTRNEGFYIPPITRTSTEELSVTAEIVTVTNDMKEGTPVALEIKYPGRDHIKVSYKASQTLVKTGTDVTIEAKANNGADSFEWTVPSGATLVSGQGTSKVVFNFQNEGIYDITIKVANDIANVTYTQPQLIEVNNSKTLNLVSVGKTIDSYSGSNEDEDPEWLIDGIQSPDKTGQKWCAEGKREHWVIIDLEQMYNIYRLRFFDAKTRENYDNIGAYKVWISKDGQQWDAVLDETGRSAEKTKDDYIAPTIGRYVKFMPYDPQTPCTIRIFEYEVYGTELGNHSIEQKEETILGLSTTEHYSLSFDWGNGMATSYDFTIKSSNSNLIKAEIVNVDIENKKVYFDLTSGNIQDKAEISVRFRNGDYTRSAIFTAIVTDLENLNRAAEVLPVLIKGGNDYDNPEDKDKLERITDENANTFWTSPYTENADCEIEIDLGATYGINKIQLHLKYIASQNHIPTEIKFYAADDKTKEYRQIISKSNGTGAAQILDGLNEYTMDRQNMRYVKLLIPGNDTYFGVSICEIGIFGKEVADKYMPLEVSGFNTDIIAESLPVQSSSVNMNVETSKIPSCVWVSRSVLPEYGLPESGKLISFSGVRYQLAPYNENNALRSVGKENAVLTLKNGVKAKKVHILTTSGPGDAYYSDTKAAYSRVKYTDGTATNYINGSFFWMRNFTNLKDDNMIISNPIAVAGIKVYKWTDGTLFDSECCLSEITINTNPEKEIASVELQGFQDGEWGYIMAVTAEEVSWTSGIKTETADNTGYRIYPNPVQSGNILTVEAPAARKIQIKTLQGAAVFSQRVQEGIVSVPTGNLIPGTYLLTIYGNNGIKTEKIIVR